MYIIYICVLYIYIFTQYKYLFSLRFELGFPASRKKISGCLKGYPDVPRFVQAMMELRQDDCHTNVSCGTTKSDWWNVFSGSLLHIWGPTVIKPPKHRIYSSGIWCDLRGPPCDASWFVNPVISLNQSKIGVMLTNLAISQTGAPLGLKHHRFNEEIIANGWFCICIQYERVWIYKPAKVGIEP